MCTRNTPVNTSCEKTRFFFFFKRAYPNTAIRKARLDDQGENLLSLDGRTVSAQIVDQRASVSPVYSI